MLAALIGSASLFYLAHPQPLAIAGLLAFAAFAWLRLDLALLAGLVFVPYFMREKHFAGHQFPVSEALLGVAVTIGCLFIIASILGVKPCRPRSSDTSSAPWSRFLDLRLPGWTQLQSSPFLVPATGFLAASLISTLAAAQFHLAAREFVEVIVEPLLFFAMLLLFIDVQDSDARTRAFVVMGVVVVLAGTGQSLIGLAQYVTHQDLVKIAGASYERIKAWYGSPDNLGLLLDRALPMTAALLLAPAAALGGLRSGNRPTTPWLRWLNKFDLTGAPWARALLLAALLVMGATLVLTFVLGAWIASFLAVVAVLVVRLRPGWWFLALAVLVVALAIAAGSTRLAHSFSTAHGVTAGRRIDVWRSSLRMIRDHPVLGVGPDNFQHYYAPRHQRHIGCQHGLGYMEPGAWPEPCLSHPHNEILDFWLSTGILGVAAFTWLQFVFWRTVWRYRSVLAARTPVLLGAAAAMLAALLHGLVDNVYFLIDLSMLTWLFFAIASLTWTSVPVAAESMSGDLHQPA